MSLDKFFKNTMLILLCLIPGALVTGPFLPDLFLSIIAIYFLIISLKKSLWSYYKNIYVYLFTFFYSYLLIRSLLSENILLSLESSLFYFRYLFFSLGVWYLSADFVYLKKYLSLFIIFTLLIVAFDGYVQWITGSDILGFQSSYSLRVSGFFNTEMIMGSYLVRLLPIGIALFVSSFFINKKMMILLMIFIIIIDVIIFGSGERLALFYAVLFTLFIFLLWKKFRFISFLNLTVLTITIIYLGINVEASNNRMIKNLYDQIRSTSLPFATYSIEHEKLYITGFKMFFDNPIFGQGPKMFRDLCNNAEFYYEDGCNTHPHNNYVQLLSETGLIGCSFLLLVFLWTTYKLFMHLLSMILPSLNKELPDSILFYLIMFFMFTIPVVPSGNFFNNWLCVIYYLPVGFMLEHYYRHKV